MKIADKFAEFFNPKDKVSLPSSIEKVVYSNYYSKMLIKKGKDRVKKFHEKIMHQKQTKFINL